MTARWERVCRVEEVEPGRPVGKVVGSSGEDRDRVCVARRPDGDYVALLDRCPHRNIQLSGGVVKDGLLTCPGHFWRFDLTTGERSDLPEVRATLYPTRVTDGWVEVSLPPPAPRRSMREWLLAQARADDGHGVAWDTTDTSLPVTSQSSMEGACGGEISVQSRDVDVDP
jgi:nitrite reductase/ring-hydroxylating ferredoxin subunit